MEHVTDKASMPSYGYKQIWHIAYPILISLAMEQMLVLTDTGFLGRVGEIEIGAAAIAGVYYMIIFMLGFGFSIGVQIMIARRNGEGRHSEIGDIFYHSVGFLLAIALVACSLSLALSPKVLQGIVSSPAVCEKASIYVYWRVLGLFFAFTSAVFRAFFVGTVQTKTLTLNSIIMVFSNVVFNYILIFGNFGFPALGIAGAAIGSTLAEGVSTTFFIIYTVRKVDRRKYGLDRIGRFNRTILKGILRISTWTMIQNFFSISIWFLFFVFIEHLGERPLAITNIVRSVSTIPFVVVTAFAATCSSVVSNLIGLGRSDEVKPAIMRHIAMAYAIVIPIVALISVFPEHTARIYTNISDLGHDSVKSMWVMCSSYLLLAPGLILFNSVSGTGNTKKAFVLEFISTMAYTVFISIVILHLRADVAYCWFAEHVYCTVILILCFNYMAKMKWAGTKI